MATSEAPVHHSLFVTNCSLAASTYQKLEGIHDSTSDVGLQ
jgi:hypothetical protein